MRDDASLAAWLRLTLAPGIGGATQRRLLGAFGLPEAIFAAGHDAVATLIGEARAARLFEHDATAGIDAARRWADEAGRRILTLADPDYPRSLLEIPDPPSVLYVRGRHELLARPALAIVGSRNPTPQGIENAEQFATALSAAGLTIASGLALGIDAAAHRGALRTPAGTVAFVGTGIDRIYPARNHALALEIGEQGCIVSELPLGSPVMAANFPRRNRLISGFARGVLVVEAAPQSGSLITARLAAEQGREVFAIPGSIHSPQARGCHTLIKQGAKLVETAQDVLEELCWPVVEPAAAPPATPDRPDEVPADERTRVLDALGHDPCAVDTLVERSGLTAEALSVMLLHLELDGRVASLPGGRYQRLSGA